MGRDGGLVSPSVYDTAQVLRWQPPAEGSAPALQWLLARQQPDGGWGDPAVPMGRDVPTLAAVLALHDADTAPEARDRALAFLRAQAPQWHDPLPIDIPIGVELILPHLLEEANAAGLELPTAPYAALIAFGQKRRELIARFRPAAGTSAVHSWEAWGDEPDPGLLDGSGGIGHSPAATAAWLRRAEGRPDLADAAARARDYLARAGAATASGIPGLVPTVYPIARFEELFLPYALLLTGLLDHPALAEALAPMVESTARALQSGGGLGFSDHFDPDGDDTAAGLAILLKTGRPVDWSCLERFESGEHFCTWRHEMQPSWSTTARAVHALSLGGRDVRAHQDFLVRQQQPDGRWTGDKWNEAWLYTTCHAVAALTGSPVAAHQAAVRAAVAAIARTQHADGGWGSDPASNATETACAVLTLFAALRAGLGDPALDGVLDRAHAWLDRRYPPADLSGISCWIGKEPYRPYRVDRSFELIALAALALRAAAPATS
jgi:hypothetical protein